MKGSYWQNERVQILLAQAILGQFSIQGRERNAEKFGGFGFISLRIIQDFLNMNLFGTCQFESRKLPGCRRTRQGRLHVYRQKVGRKFGAV